MRLLKWLWGPPLILPGLMGLFIAEGVISWRTWLFIVAADVLDDVWRAYRLWKQEGPSRVEVREAQ